MVTGEDGTKIFKRLGGNSTFVKFLKSKTTQCFRLVVRTKGTFHLMCNTPVGPTAVSKKFSIQSSTNTTKFIGLDENGTVSVFQIRFASSTDEFKDKFISTLNDLKVEIDELKSRNAEESSKNSAKTVIEKDVAASGRESPQNSKESLETQNGTKPAGSETKTSEADGTVAS
eukprot:Filipodium_phascolosomae@DN5686_c0_g1_i2.p1